jgi:hypothetical protein
MNKSHSTQLLLVGLLWKISETDGGREGQTDGWPSVTQEVGIGNSVEGSIMNNQDPKISSRNILRHAISTIGPKWQMAMEDAKKDNDPLSETPTPQSPLSTVRCHCTSPNQLFWDHFVT